MNDINIKSILEINNLKNENIYHFNKLEKLLIKKNKLINCKYCGQEIKNERDKPKQN